VTVRDLAEATGIDQKSLAKTLRRLEPTWVNRRDGLLTRHTDRRKTYYELAEPLTRVAIEIKANRGEPLRTVVDFLTAWYSRMELRDRLGLQPDDAAKPNSAEALTGGAGVLDETLRLALAEAETPGKVVLEHLVRGFAPQICVIGAPPLAGRSDALVSQCAQIDAALSGLQHTGTADGVLALPGAISALLESRLEEDSPGILRLELAMLAAHAGGDDCWIDRALDAAAGVRDHEARLARVLIGCVRLGLWQYEAGLASLEHADAAGPLTIKELGAVGAALDCMPPDVYLRALRWCAERTLPMELIWLIAQFAVNSSRRLMAQAVHSGSARPTVGPCYSKRPGLTEDTVYHPPDQSVLARMADDVVQVAARTDGVADLEPLVIRCWLGVLLANMDQDEAAVILLETTVAAFEGTQWTGSDLHISSRGLFGLALAKLGRITEARAQVRALEAAEREWDPCCPLTAQLRKMVEGFEKARAAPFA
jgi:hypothetical protein